MKRFVFVLFPLLVACASAPAPEKTLEEINTEAVHQNSFDKGLKQLEQLQYADAAKTFDALLVAKPATEFDLVALYNAGAAYEGLGECTKASERYRSAVRSSGNKYPRIEAEALFRLSLMYECLGKDVKAIAALIDAKKRGKSLPLETLQAQIPARLAAAYARIGNRKKALEYFSVASEGLKKIIARETPAQKKEILSRTLFMMGALTPAQRNAEVSPQSFFQSLTMQQPYLLQAAEMGHPNWSKRAAEDLTAGYDNIWKFKFDDPEKQRDFYMRGLQAAKELEKIRLPNEGELVAGVFNHVIDTESRLQAELSKTAETTHLTPAAQKRQALKRQGRAVDPGAKTKKPKKQ
jgi:tetratricopeptide (TPR) repeat protein